MNDSEIRAEIAKQARLISASARGPAPSAVDLTTGVTGILPRVNGGTQASDAAGARASLDTVQTTRAISTTTPITGGGDLTADRTIALVSGSKGDILVHNGTNWVKLSTTGDGKVLFSDSVESTGLKWLEMSGLPAASTKGTIAVWSGVFWDIIVPGADGTKLTADSTTGTGLKWA